MDSYQMVLAAGADPAHLTELGDAVADITLSAYDADHVRDVFAAAGVTPSDTRSRLLVALDGPVPAALAGYAAAVGFAGRIVDIATAGNLLRAEGLHAKLGKQAATLERPDPRLDRVVLAASDDESPARDGEDTVVRVDVDAAQPLSGMTADQLAHIRYARRVTVVCPDDLLAAVTMVTMVAGVRSRRGNVRLPELLVAGELVDLEGVRQVTSELRRDIRPYTLALAPTAEPTERQQRLNAAADIPVEQTMGLLGARHNADEDAWHCPRPERHSNGDATPSMRVTDGKLRCYRCDSEWVDSLRLVVDSLDVSHDEAADLLLDRPDWATALLAERRASSDHLVD